MPALVELGGQTIGNIDYQAWTMVLDVIILGSKAPGGSGLSAVGFSRTG
jgi:hypothetical protein